MSRIVISGSGAVTPAGWGVPAMMAALATDEAVGVSEISRESRDGRQVTTRVARVPALTDRSLLPREPRLRRTSPLGKFAAAAALEALGPERFEAVKAGQMSLGVICTVMNGCVNYSNRFFGEVLVDPSVASPILFPETVYNAPSSHISAMCRATAPNDTLVGDGAEFFTGLELATEWLLRGDCELCLVVSAEEIDWLSAEGAGLYHRGVVPAEGAAAVLLEKDGDGVELLSVPDPVSYADEPDRIAALRRLIATMDFEDKGLLADGRCGLARIDRAEDAVFEVWRGPRVSTRTVLGEALGASAAMQVVAAMEMLRRGDADRAVATAVGSNEQVAGCVIGR